MPRRARGPGAAAGRRRGRATSPSADGSTSRSTSSRPSARSGGSGGPAVGVTARLRAVRAASPPPLALCSCLLHSPTGATAARPVPRATLTRRRCAATVYALYAHPPRHSEPERRAHHCLPLSSRRPLHPRAHTPSVAASLDAWGAAVHTTAPASTAHVSARVARFSPRRRGEGRCPKEVYRYRRAPHIPV